MKRFTLMFVVVLMAAMSWAQEPITTVPEGATEAIYTRAGKSFYPQKYGEDTYIYEGNQGGSMTICYAPGNEVYLKDPVYGYKHNTYVKGTLSADSTTIMVALPQVLSVNDGIPVVLGIGKYDDETKEYSLDETVKQITYRIIRQDENITVELDETATKETPYGDFWGDNGEFAGRAEWNTELTRYVEKTEVVEVSEEKKQELQTTPLPLGGAYWAKDKDNYEYIKYGYQMKVAYDGDTVYVQGLVPALPEAWAKGVKKNGVVSFPVQLLNIDENNTKYFLAGLSGDGLNMSPFNLFYNEELNSYTAESRLILNPSDLDYDEDQVLGYYTGIYVGERPALVQLPSYIGEDEIQEMLFEGTYDNGQKKVPTAGIVNVVVDNMDVYIQGLVKSVPNGWVKGAIDEDSYADVFIPYGQYVGYDAEGNVFAVGDKWDIREFISSDVTQSVDDPANIHLSFDSEANSFKLQNNFYMSRKADDIDRGNVLRYGLTINEGALWVPAEEYADVGESADVTEVEVADGVKVAFDKAEGTNSPKYYKNGEAVRLYKSNTMTVSSADKVIGKVVFIFTGSNYANLTTESGSLYIDGNVGVWTGDADELVFSVPSGQARIKYMSVYFFDYSNTLATVPVDLVTKPYLLAGEEPAQFFGDPTPKSFNVNVGVKGSDVYFQGFSEHMPQAWLKGKLVDNKVTVPGWYMGFYENPEDITAATFDVVFSGVEFAYNSDTDVYASEEGFKTTNPAGYEGFNTVDHLVNVTLTPQAEVAATPVNPSVTGFEGLADERYVALNIPLADTENKGIYSEKLSFVVLVEKDGQPSQLTFAKDLYTTLEQDLTEIPYSFTDNETISRNRIALLQPDEELRSWAKIGVQSIYRGAGEERKSEVFWYELSKYWADGIVEVAENEPVGTMFFDLQGRQADTLAKGLLIQQVRMSDGTVKTMKVLRK